MLRVEIDWLVCQACNPCMARAACRTRAIVKIDSDTPAYVEMERCNACMKCLSACDFGAISIYNPTLDFRHEA